MRVLHIVPSAFEYFDDIRASAFALMEKMRSLGVESDAFTLQYGSVSRGEQSEVAARAPSQRFLGMGSAVELIKACDEYDIIHVHCPLLGAVGKIIAWKKTRPGTPVVATFHRRVVTPDFFSLGIVWYNMYYLPQLFKVASAITAPSASIFHSSFGSRLIKTSGKFYEIDASSDWLGERLTSAPSGPDEVVALKYALLYNKLLKN